jgi:hypothetical protein
MQQATVATAPVRIQAPAAPGASGIDVARIGLVMLSLGAGLVHLAAAGPHFAGSGVFGAFFVATGLLQLTGIRSLLQGPSRRALVASVAGNAFLVALWTMSRTIGVSLGSHAWTPEAVGFPDAFATVAEMLIVTGSLMLLAPGTRSRLESSEPRRAALTILGTAATVTALTAVSLGGTAMGHHHTPASPRTPAGAAIPVSSPSTPEEAVGTGLPTTHTHP